MRRMQLSGARLAPPHAITTLLMSTECNIMGTRYEDGERCQTRRLPAVTASAVPLITAAARGYCHRSHVIQTFIIIIIIIITEDGCGCCGCVDTDVTVTFWWVVEPSVCWCAKLQWTLAGLLCRLKWINTSIRWSFVASRRPYLHLATMRHA